MNRQIVNVETGEEVIVPIDETELEQLQARFMVEKEAKLQELASKAALLEKLGITEDEAKLLLS